MRTIFKYGNKIYLTLGCLFIAIFGFSQTITSPQVNFTQRTSTATPTQTIYNVKGDFTLLGNINLTLLNYGATTDNESNIMKYVDVDSDPNTLNSSMATLELSNSGENSATQNCSTVLFAGLYWTGKSDDANETFSISNVTASHNFSIPNTNYVMTVALGGSSSNYYPIYNFTGNGHTYAFSFTNNTSGSSIVTLKIDGGASTDIPVTYNSGKATFTTPYTSDASYGSTFTINSLTRNTSKSYSLAQYQSTSFANVNYSPSKNYDKMVVSIKGPGATTYTTVTTTSDIRFPGAANSGIFIGYQEITTYVKAHGPGSYTVADIALKEGTNSNPGLSGGWGMVVIYENPLMKSRAVTLFDGYAYVNGQFAGGGEYGNIDISGFTTVGSGQVNMKLGVMAAEGDVNLSGDYLAVQKLNADPAVYPANYLVLNHAGNSTNNFFNSSIYPFPTVGDSNPNLVNNTGVDFSMFTIPNTGNLVIGNNQTSTTFRFGSSSDVFTIFGFAMSVDAYIPEPKGLISVNSINNITNPPTLNALPGQTINYSLDITNEGTEATNNTIITIPIPATAIFHTGTITYTTYNGFTTGNTPYYDSGTNKILWNLGSLPITDNHPEYIYADISFTLDVTTDCSIILNAGCSPEVSLETGTITGTGAVSASPFTKYFFQGYDETSCHLPIDGSIKVAIDTSSCLSAMAGSDQTVSCGGNTTTLAATEITGLWSIVSGPSGGGEIFSDNTSPTSEFSSPNLGIYTLRWTTSCATTDDVLVTFENCNVINFDGIDDHINFQNEFNLNSISFSIEVWVKSEATNSNTQTIISKRFNTSSTDGFDLRLVNNYISFNWNNGNSITSTYPIDSNRWYQVAVTFSGTDYNLYVDGILVAGPISGVNPTSNSVNFIVGAMDQNNITPFNYFNGWMDELRIWNIELTTNQIRQMMNQEIYDDGNGNVKGAIIPKNINGLSWTNLLAYYQMNGATDINNGYLMDKASNSINGKLKNIYTSQPETAPLPYTSRANSAWETDNTWTHYAVWDVPYSIGIDSSTKIDWNIVETSHNISSNGNKIVLGLIVTINTLSAENDSKLEVSSYLKLDGKIDLVGKSQLVQTTESDLDVTSEGFIERDQQGQANLYNYNYWCSPVSTINYIDNNTDFTIGDIMKDGTSSTPQNITWIGGYDGAATSPISLARYWLYTFDNYINEYANWNQILETTPIRVGQGYTMKGSGTEGGFQNYTFVGKPNNGLITSNAVGDDQILLTGNPYPSALDANAFINDNIDSIDGTLYFWEHYSTNNTHILRDYQGGYAERNLTGGVAPTSSGVDYISGLGSPSRGIPNQFVPVGQGFFVNGKIGSGGTVIFKNSQRGFHKEDEVGVSNVMYKATANHKTKKTTDNINDPIPTTDTYMKIRLGFNSNNGYHRQVLLGFMNEKATSGMDYGYDALNIDDFPNDMYFLVEENQLVIQGVSYFDINASIPIGVKTNVEGKVSFVLDATENFTPEQPIFIYDTETDTYNDIRNGLFEVNLPIGVTDTRFSLRFTDKTLGVSKVTNTSNDIKITHIQNGNILVINNNKPDVNVEKMTLFNILGKSIATWKIENQEQQNIQIPIKNISSGIYIVKVKTSKENINKKIIIN
ncbi:MAG: T9SS type A sorting domain-containing protein [Flavobacterium sp.]|uniref:LamG-like jellyroll fold domain-containing protein n=1 Tax=Flavobacterium sp. TaxID=239 RepID=UPI00262EFE92|nr:LamG-like jellyroll fold domain-containing protein [Flavobacterium sp.]MDD5150017.1 T9SS type A sorting domain-containing protein [Flavobacterium sp.]